MYLQFEYYKKSQGKSHSTSNPLLVHFRFTYVVEGHNAIFKKDLIISRSLKSMAKMKHIEHL